MLAHFSWFGLELLINLSQVRLQMQVGGTGGGLQVLGFQVCGGLLLLAACFRTAGSPAAPTAHQHLGADANATQLASQNC